MNLNNSYKNNLAYIIGAALGDGNLSNPNKRAARLRITCDKKYNSVINNFTQSIQIILPTNKVSITNRKDNCVDISCYANKWEKLLGWKADGGSKYDQNVRIPKWIATNKKFILICLRGLFETDGSIYMDRKYKMINFTTIIPALADDVIEMIRKIGFKPNIQMTKYTNKKTKFTIRISKNASDFITMTKIQKK